MRQFQPANYLTAPTEKPTEGAKKLPPQPAINVNVSWDEKGASTILPTRESIKRYAKWEANARDVRVTPDVITISGSRFGTIQIPPRNSQRLPAIDQKAFWSWADKVMGVGAVSSAPADEIGILEKIYANMDMLSEQKVRARQLELSTAAKKDQTILLTRMEIDKLTKEKAPEVLDHDFGSPKEFIADLQALKTFIESEGLKLEKSAKLYLYGQLFAKHLFELGRGIQMDENFQPKVVTEDANKIPAAFVNVTDNEWTDAVKKSKGFLEEMGDYTTGKDNVGQIAEYIAAYTFHAFPGLPSTPQNLTDYKKQLLYRISGPNKTDTPTKQDIEKSSLNAAEKSFLLAWNGKEKDDALNQISKDQNEYVVKAEENMGSRSPEQLMADFVRKPLSTTMETAGIVVVPWLIYRVSKGLLGENSKIAKFIGFITKLFTVGAVAMNYKKVEKLWTKYAGNNLANGVDKVNPVDAGSIMEYWAEIKNSLGEKMSRLQARFTGPEKWSDLLMDPNIGPEASTLPVYDMLAALNNDKDLNPYHPANAATAKIQADLCTKLEKYPGGDKRPVMNTLLTNIYDLYQDTPDGKDPQKLHSATIDQMLTAIEKNDKWYYDGLDKTFGVGIWNSSDEMKNGFRLIARKPHEWGAIKLQDLKNYTGKTSNMSGPIVSQITALISDYSSNHKGNGNEGNDFLKSFVDEIDGSLKGKNISKDITLKKALETINK